MDFVVETISTDSFYSNLLLGLPKVLEKNKRFGIKKLYLMRHQPVPNTEICAWEQKNGILFPEDLRNFYSSTDGFCYTWFCEYGMRKTNVTGKLEISPLNKVIQVVGYRTHTDPGVQLDGVKYKLKLGQNSKVFEISQLENTKICVVYLTTRFVPTIWLCTQDMQFYYLADNFTMYFRMAIAHLGFPYWQLLYTPHGIPEWAKVLIRLFYPKMLNKRTKTVEVIKKDRSKKLQDNYPVNKLDVNVFKYHTKSIRPTTTVVRRDKTPSPSKSPRKKKYYWVKSRYLKKGGNNIIIKSNK
ncbi:tubulin polyglutamylase complex subunit 2 [Onthophagus taurus]|uniref:tubulin polyglutamylase complex subunit 2 n=1 Tax=Onthophagus taurus TaxID=166361 RepID=UPI0039BE3478